MMNNIGIIFQIYSHSPSMTYFTFNDTLSIKFIGFRMKLKEGLDKSDICISIVLGETEENRDRVCYSHYTGSRLVLTVCAQ
jgi:hypothetical protein